MSRRPFTQFVLSLVVVLTAGGVPLSAAENASFATAVRSITSVELRKHVDVLADDTFEGREAGSRGGRAAAMYLMKEFQRHELKPLGDNGTYFQDFENGSRNILGLLEGSDPDLKAQVIIVGAHYDHVGYGSPRNSYGPFGNIHNGADDNASGVSGLLEIVDALRTLPQRPARSILFALWDGEEKGLNGSKYWTAHPTVKLEQCVFAVNLDMIGRLRNQGVEVYGSRTLTGLRQRISLANRETTLPLDFTWEMKEDSDHWSFYKRNIPVVMFHTGLHPEYHRPSDDAHLLNYSGIEQVSQLVFGLVHELGNEPQLTSFRTASRREGAGNRTLLEAAAAPPTPRFGVSWIYDAEQTKFQVTAVTFNGPAEKGGLRKDDEIVDINGVTPTSEAHLRLEILYAPQPTTVRVRRAGQEELVSLQIEPAGNPVRLGLAWREDDAEPGLLLVTQVIPHSAAAMAGVKVKDRVYRVNGEGFANGQDFISRLKGDSTTLELTLERRGQFEDVRLELLPLR